MSAVEAALARAASDLDAAGARWALIGGLAVSVRTFPRFTQDVDLAVAVADDVAAEALVAGLLRNGYATNALLEQSAARRLATVRLTPPGFPHPAPSVDLLFASSGIEPELVAEAERLEVFPGQPARVAGIAHLIALKTLSMDDRRRPQDRGDALALIRVARVGDLDRTRALLALVTARGFHRDLDLLARLDALLADAQ